MLLIIMNKIVIYKILKEIQISPTIIAANPPNNLNPYKKFVLLRFFAFCETVPNDQA